MPLPILTTRPQATPEDLVRFYHRCELHWCSQIAEQTTLDAGTALTNLSLSQVHDANQIMDATLPDGLTPQQAHNQVTEHFAAAGVRCHKWTLAPSAPIERTAPLAEYLLASGYTTEGDDVMYLAGQPTSAIEEVSGLTIIPARASFKHARDLAAEATASHNTPQLVDAWVGHLEDPSTDGLLALENGVVVALVTVLTVGEIGCIENLHVAQSYRRRGIGRTMMSRALEICARALFKHVFIGVHPTNTIAAALYAQLGFQKIGRMTSYYARP
jgi:ribosomal protein S18 acetylase RimI-like enzyme